MAPESWTLEHQARQERLEMAIERGLIDELSAEKLDNTDNQKQRELLQHKITLIISKN
jgi:hypothetical protein